MVVASYSVHTLSARDRDIVDTSNWRPSTPFDLRQQLVICAPDLSTKTLVRAKVTSSLPSTDVFEALSESSERLERSDDPQPLAAVVENLASRVATLEASNTGESGVVGFAPHAQPNVIASNGGQSRTHRVHINFARPFASTPWVSLGMSEVDEYNTANLRIVLGVDAVSTSGFDAHAYEWGDTNVVSVTAFWVACNKEGLAFRKDKWIASKTATLNTQGMLGGVCYLTVSPPTTTTTTTLTTCCTQYVTNS
ncbi:hypothetical protein C0Q70_10575 [Pomacea canaliculata]|uniref:H-type lectin domain-containing protein n=1 Tax=Pomacea canaliculata TaxID=400727 RepID=A0A2T7P3L1_POMCA|nr:hypothetical protein C0Q70_10575 [Pomacea canaliculata]